MWTLIEEARSVCDGLRAFALMNLADPGEQSADNAEAMAKIKAFEYLTTLIRRRKAFSNAGADLSVADLSPRDPKAIADIEALASSLFNIQ